MKRQKARRPKKVAPQETAFEYGVRFERDRCVKKCEERAHTEMLKALQERSRKNIAFAQMYEQNAAQALLMAQEIRGE